MSRRRTWVLVVVSIWMAVVCCRQVSAARDVPEVRMRRVCIAGVRVELSSETPERGAASPDERRPQEIDEPCGFSVVPLSLPVALR
jgi:hypothetical protein